MRHERLEVWVWHCIDVAVCVKGRVRVKSGRVAKYASLSFFSSLFIVCIRQPHLQLAKDPRSDYFSLALGIYHSFHFIFFFYKRTQVTKYFPLILAKHLSELLLSL